MHFDLSASGRVTMNDCLLSTLARWLLWAVSGQCKLTANNLGHSKVFVIDRCLLWTGVCYGQVSVMDRCLLWTGVCYRQVSVMDRCMLWTSVCYGQVSVMDRWLLWTGVR